jgi:glycosyltransferase involved in cell wall biosynthesis
MKIELCIPAHNEGTIIAESAQHVVRVLRENGRNAQVTVIDNASADDTAAIARRIDGVTVLAVTERGKGAAVVGAARASNTEIFGFIDADLSVDPEEAIPMLVSIENGVCDIAIGSRLIDSSIVDRGMLRSVSSRVFNAIRRMIVGIKAEDTQCGLKIMNARGRAILALCNETGWFFDVEFLARAERAGLRIQEVPVHWNEHRFADRASKLRLLRDGFGAIAAMLRIRYRAMLK